MMLVELFLKGLVIGFSIAAPVGPIGLLCIRRTLAEGWITGLVSGLGAASADAMYGLIAAMGLTVISTFLVDEQLVLQLIGGSFLVYLGLKTLWSRPTDRPADAGTDGKGGLAGVFLSTFVLTLTNPLTILSFVAIFAGLGLGAPAAGFSGGPVLVAGVFIGSAAWWLLLSSAVNLFRNRMRPAALQWVNRLSGVLILVFGLGALYGGAVTLFQ